MEPAEAGRVLAEAIALAIRDHDHSVRFDGDWPRYAWGRSTFSTIEGGSFTVVWEARLTNLGRGTYEAYPVDVTRHHQLMLYEVREKLWPLA